MLAELASIRDAGLDDGQDIQFPFRLISRRLPNVYNSSGRDIAKLNGRRPYNPAFLHPDDLLSLGLSKGDVIEISSAHASILGVAEPAPEVRRGVISMAHCFGDIPETETKKALRDTGSNTSRLVSNEDVFDPHTGIPRMSAIPVAIERA